MAFVGKGLVFHRGDVSLAGRLVFYLKRMGCEGFGEVDDKKRCVMECEGDGGSNKCNCRVHISWKGEGLLTENQAEGCEFSQPLRKIL